jgi:hypothetical protein
MQGHHAGAKTADEYVVELGHNPEASRELMNANFQRAKQALVSRGKEFLLLYLFADKLLLDILLSEFRYYLGAYQ